MKHTRPITVARAQIVNIDLSNPINFLIWIGSIVWFVKEWNS